MDQNQEKENNADQLLPKKKKGKISRFILGAIIGSAVGSIIGAAFAPKSGKQLRKEMARNSKKTWSNVKNIIEKKSHHQDSEGKGIWHFLHRVFIKKKNEEN